MTIKPGVPNKKGMATEPSTYLDRYSPGPLFNNSHPTSGTQGVILLVEERSKLRVKTDLPLDTLAPERMRDAPLQIFTIEGFKDYTTQPYL